MSVLIYGMAILANINWIVHRQVMSLEGQIMIPMLTVLLLGLGALAGMAGLSREEKKRCLHRILWVILLYYLAILSVLLFFGGLFHVDRVWGGAVNLEPFHTIRNFIIHYQRTGSFYSLSNLVGNIVILIPLGVLLPVMFRPMRKFWIFLPFAALFAVGVEYIQWKTATGIADVDDSILNFIGAAGGYFVTRLCQIFTGLCCRLAAQRGERSPGNEERA